MLRDLQTQIGLSSTAFPGKTSQRVDRRPKPNELYSHQTRGHKKKNKKRMTYHPPGNRAPSTTHPSLLSRSRNNSVCVVLPLRSRPSSTMNAPLTGCFSLNLVFVSAVDGVCAWLLAVAVVVVAMVSGIWQCKLGFASEWRETAFGSVVNCA